MSARLRSRYVTSNYSFVFYPRCYGGLPEFLPSRNEIHGAEVIMNKTQENLLKAFVGESIVRNKYIFFADRAREEGYEWIAKVFRETASNERAHAEKEYEHIKNKVELNGNA